MTTQSALIFPLPEQKKTSVMLKVLVIISLMTIIGGSLTAIMTYMNVGFSQSFISSWLSSFALVALVMIPIGIGLMTLVTKLIRTLMPKKIEKFHNIVIGVIMAVIMESLMALITTTNNIEFSNTLDFTTEWLKAFLTALPIGLTIMLLMTLTIKPKIESFLKS